MQKINHQYLRQQSAALSGIKSSRGKIAIAAQFFQSYSPVAGKEGKTSNL